MTRLERLGKLDARVYELERAIEDVRRREDGVRLLAALFAGYIVQGWNPETVTDRLARTVGRVRDQRARALLDMHRKYQIFIR